MNVMFCPDCIKPYPDGVAADNMGRCASCSHIAKQESLLEQQTAFRKLQGLEDIPAGECEGCGNQTFKVNGVCEGCEELGWKSGNVLKLKPYIAYYRPPDNTKVEESDEVEVMAGEHKGVTGVIATLSPNGDVKIWPHDSKLDPKLWLHKPDLRCVQKVS